MGTVGSLLHSNDDDDILDLKIRGRSGGVIKHIPIEMKPRGKLGLGRVGSVGRKPKGGSLRSALSIDLENPETERIKREFEMYRLDKENDIANWQKKEKKLEQENKRMRSELLALQKTCTKLRNERDAALQAEQRALARAASFECDRDKVQRRFKIYRETAEYELQNVLRDRRNLEHKITKYSPGYMPEDGDSGSRFLVEGTLGNNNAGDWWSEPSLGSTVQLHQPTHLRGPEFAHTMMELEGPFTNVNKDDWSSALANMNQSMINLTEQAISRVKRIFISATQYAEVEVFMKEYVPSLKLLCQNEGRTLVVVFLKTDNYQLPSLKLQKRCEKARKKQIDLSSLFIAFVSNASDRETICDLKYIQSESNSIKPQVVVFKDISDKRMCVNGENEEGFKLKEGSQVHVINEYVTSSQAAELVYTTVERILKTDLGIDKDKTDDQFQTENHLCGGAMWDVNYDFEQMEALSYSLHSSCELGFEKYFEKLNGHVSAAGPYPPLLVMGSSGCGRSLLLSKWVQQQKEKNPNSLVLYHFVGTESSVSADPILMIRRLSAQLMQQVNNPPVLTSDSTRLVEDFPRWLEKISSKSPGGTILVLDSIDRFQQAEVHLKWLLDPLPVDARVVVSAEEDTCPQVWRSWPTLSLDVFNEKAVHELLKAELSVHEILLSNENENRILSHCQSMNHCSPLYVKIIAGYIISCGGEEDEQLSEDLDILLSCSSCEKLYIQIIALLESSLEPPEKEGMIRLILKYVCVSRNGMEENELMDLIPDLTWSFLVPVIDILSIHLIIKYQSGVVTFAQQAAMRGIHELCFGKDDCEAIADIRQELIDYHSRFLIPGSVVTCRVADELPWLIRKSENKERLKNCILNLCIFQRLYARGRSSELLAYWQYLDIDKNHMATAYLTATKKTEEAIGHQNGCVNLPLIADMYETLGRFLKDMVLLNQALQPLQKALEIRETAMDPDHPLVAHSLHQLAGLHAQWGKYKTAEALFRQALEIYESAFGFDHTLVAKEVEALANLYQKQNKHDLAEPLRKRAMSIKKRIKTLQTGNTNVDKLQRRTLHLEELALGPESPDLARTLNELGVLYYVQNDWETSESFFKRSLEMRENLLGKDHLDLAQSLNNLAALYNDKKMFDKAEPLYERALQIRLKHLSPDSAGVSGIVLHLAMLYRKQNKFEKAEPLYKQAVEIRENCFGSNHPSVATALVNLAVLYSQQNKYFDAEPAYERALKIYEESLGPHHARVAETLRNLAVMKYEQKDFETAAKLYKRSTEIKENETTYTSKVLSRHSSGGETNSTIKNILQT